MKLEHEFTVQVPVEEAWVALLDLENVVPCFPGAALTSTDGDEFSGTCAIRLGPIALKYAGTGRFVTRDEAARRVVMEAKGKDGRGNGTAAAAVEAVLTPAGDDATLVSVVTDIALTGKAGQFGRGVVQDVSDRMLQQFVDNLQARLQRPDEDAPAAAQPSGRPAPAAELNLGATVLPVLARRYGPALLVVALLIAWRRARR
jgi:carbon monoxide dehydrogenase subunit G